MTTRLQRIAEWYSDWSARHLVVQVLGTFLLIFAGMFALEHLYNRAKAATFWAEYYGVNPVRPVFKEGDPLVMRTQVHIKRPVYLAFHDVLFCRVRQSTEYRFVSDYRSNSRHGEEKYIGFEGDLPAGIRKSIPVTSGRWEYGGRLPRTPSTCYMKSDISWSPSLGVEKSIEIDSDIFMIVPADAEIDE